VEAGLLFDVLRVQFPGAANAVPARKSRPTTFNFERMLNGSSQSKLFHCRVMIRLLYKQYSCSIKTPARR